MNDLCQYDGLKACLDKILCQNKNKEWNIWLIKSLNLSLKFDDFTVLYRIPVSHIFVTGAQINQNGLAYTTSDIKCAIWLKNCEEMELFQHKLWWKFD
jgi:hypothetical protein